MVINFGKYYMIKILHGGHSSVGRVADCESVGRGFEPHWSP